MRKEDQARSIHFKNDKGEAREAKVVSKHQGAVRPGQKAGNQDRADPRKNKSSEKGRISLATLGQSATGP